MAPQRVRVTMLGGFDVRVHGVAVAAGVWRLKKARSLPKLLALVDGNRMHRDAVVEALWPDLRAASAGRAYDAAAALEPLVETRPVDEELRRALMLAYDADGRRWEAVAVYESLGVISTTNMQEHLT
jgi:DNA-binding SARP family transcriptional activator